jgi:flavin reductase (DIM6/NTAB) family NADH-FMN oxidoreductase RutF
MGRPSTDDLVARHSSASRGALTEPLPSIAEIAAREPSKRPLLLALRASCDEGEAMAVTRDEFKQVMGSFAAGVTVVTTVDKSGRRWGLTATAFTSLSLDPPLCLVCVDRRAGSAPAMRESRTFGVSLLSDGQEALSNRFASRLDDKFDGVAYRTGGLTGVPLLEGALAALECEVVDIHAGGDHDIFVGQLVAAHAEPGGKPLVYWRGRYGDVAPRG